MEWKGWKHLRGGDMPSDRNTGTSINTQTITFILSRWMLRLPRSVELISLRASYGSCREQKRETIGR
jgi:hypothetical protein